MKLLNVSQVAKMLQVNRTTVYRRMWKGFLPKPVRTGGDPRWDEAEIIEYLRRDKNQLRNVA